MNNTHKGNYGVPRDINARVKIMGLIILDIIFVGGSTLLAFVFGIKIFPNEQWMQFLAFMVLTAIWTLYLVLPTNGGKKNWRTIYLFFRRRRHRYISIDRMK